MISSRAFFRFCVEGGQFVPRPSGPVMFACLRSNVIYVLFQRTFEWDWRMALSGEEGALIGGQFTLK